MARRGEQTRNAVETPVEQPRLVNMIGIVALLVAIVILVFFGLGYLFGRAFL